MFIGHLVTRLRRSPTKPHSSRSDIRRRIRRSNFFVPSLQQLEDRRVLAAFLVDTTDDTPDAIPGDGIAEDSNGNTSLRAAIMEGNAFTDVETQITLPAGNYQLTRIGRLENAAATGDLDIGATNTAKVIRILGAGAGVTVIDAATIDRVFEVLPLATLALSGLTVQGGDATDDGRFEGTGQGGGILSVAAAVEIDATVITGNRATGSTGGAGLGGGVYSVASTMSFTSSVIEGNQAVGAAAEPDLLAGDAQGGGIFSGGSTWLEFTKMTVADNQAIGGDASSSDLSIPGGAGFGGGIFSQTSTWDFSSALPQPRTGVLETTIAGNQATGGTGGAGGRGGDAIGGGVYADGDTWTLLNSTISTNEVVGGSGGAGAPGGSGGDAFGGGMAALIGTSASISYVTMALNLATGGSGTTDGDGQGGGLFHDNTGAVSALSTIFATNSASTLHPDVSGDFVSNGHNLVGDATGSGTSFDGLLFDQVGTSASPINPLLGPLQNNGGPTETHALIFGSPAIDRADGSNFPATDQRAVSRPIDGDSNGIAVRDIGAYEAPQAPAQIQIQKFVKKEVTPPTSGQDLCATIGRPLEVTFRYTGGGPSATNTHQPPGKFSVVGDPQGALTVVIRVTGSATASTTGSSFFSGTVALDATFTAKASNAGQIRFPSNTFIHIFDTSMNLLQTVQYHTSCSAPIVLGDVTGGVTLTGVVGETGSASLPPPAPPGDFGDDADNPPGPTIHLGETVRWTYVVTNPGSLPISNVVVSDDNETPGNPFDDFRPDAIAVTVGAAQFNFGDTDRDNQLDNGEQWLYSAKAVVASAGQHVNVGKATGGISGGSVTATDPAHYFVPLVCIDIQMQGNLATYGNAGNILTFSAGGISVKASGFSREKSKATWAPAYLGAYSGGLGVTDTSEGYGSNNSHTVDNIGRHNYVLFEFSKPVVVDRAFLGYVVGDSDITVWIGNASDPFNNHLILNDSVLSGLGFTEVNSTTLNTPRWADINAGGVVGNVLVIAASTSELMPADQFKIAKLTTCDPGQLPKAAIDIEKATNGQDADKPVGVQLPVGSTATFTYEVRNFGSLALSNIVVRDDNGTPENAADDFTPAPVLSGGSNVGDLDNNNRLDLTEVWQYTASRTVTPGQHSNLGRVSGKTTDGRTVRDSDASNHFGLVNGPAVDIEKFVRGGTSQQQVGVDLCIDHGKPVALTVAYTGGGPEATNTHQQSGKFSVTGNPNGAATVYIRVTDRPTASDRSGRQYFYGLLNLNGEFTVLASNGGQTQFSSNTYFHLFADYAATVFLQTVGYHTSCSAPIVLGDVTGSITLTGFIGEDAQSIAIPPPNSIGELGMDADTPNGPSINVGQQVQWTYRVTNTGNQPLKDVVVTDDKGTTFLGDDFNPAPLLLNNFNIGDVDKNGLLDSTETWHYRAVDKVLTDGLYKNIGKVAAKTVTTNVATTDTDPAHYLGVIPVVNANQAGQYPQVLVMRYTGDNLISTSQSPGKVTATGNLNGATTVRIKVTNNSNPSSSSARVYFEDQVVKNQIFSIDADRAGQNKLDSTTYVHIFTATGQPQLLRTIRFESSRSQPLVLKDRYGGIMLVGYLGEKGAAFGIQPPTVIPSDLLKTVTFAGKNVFVDLANQASSRRFATIQSLVVDWASSNKKLRSIKLDDKYIYDRSTPPTSVQISSFDGDLALRRFGPGTTIRLTFEFESNASTLAGGFKLRADLGNGLIPLIP